MSGITTRSVREGRTVNEQNHVAVGWKWAGPFAAGFRKKEIEQKLATGEAAKNLLAYGLSSGGFDGDLARPKVRSKSKGTGACENDSRRRFSRRKHPEFCLRGIFPGNS